jgi:hypothetical protein
MFEPDQKRLAVAAHQLRAEASFKKTKEILNGKGIELLLLKGPHLGSTVYDHPGQRLYADLDILVRPKDFKAAANALEENGFKPLSFSYFCRKVQEDFKHWEYGSPYGWTIELHRWLSGHDRFDIDVDVLFDRAEPFLFGETPALGLGHEDLLLHLCLHMGTSYFKLIERKHVLDIALLVQKREIDWPVFLVRVKQAGMRAIAYYSLKAAMEQDGARVPGNMLKELRPGRFRCAWLERFIDTASFPIYRSPDDPWARAKRMLLLPFIDGWGRRGKLVLRMIAHVIKDLLRKSDSSQ